MISPIRKVKLDLLCVGYEFFLYHTDFSPTLEIVRQMLGLEEEQVVEISGDHSKYEVRDFLKLINLSHPPHIRFLTPYTGPFSRHNRYLSFIEYLCRLFLSLRQTSLV